MLRRLSSPRCASSISMIGSASGCWCGSGSVGRPPDAGAVPEVPLCGNLAAEAKKFAPALDMYPECPELAAKLNGLPQDERAIPSDPRDSCQAMRGEWVKLTRTTNRDQSE
jgi:hypothetical protein